MEHSDILERKIEELRPRFLEMLSERLNHFEGIRDVLETTENSYESLDQIQFGAHQIAGIAATLGYADLGSLSRAVETEILLVLVSSPNPLTSPYLLDLIDSLLGEMALLVP